MAEIILNRPNWLGSEVGVVRKTVTISSTTMGSSTGNIVPTVENGRTIVKSGTLIYVTGLGYGLLWNDADITDGAVVKSMMIRGSYIDSKLPTSVASSVTVLNSQGLFAIEYPDTNIAYGEVTD